MSKAQTTKSGNWRVRVYDGRDDNGKQKFVSFTGPTKEEVEYKAAVYHKMYKGSESQLTFCGALNNYISDRENVLSPNTLREYRRAQRTFEECSFGLLALYKITAIDIQTYINKYSVSRAPKTVRNHYGLISSVLKYYRPDFMPNIKLPQANRVEIQIPTESEIDSIIAYARVRSPEMVIPIMLASFGPLRRGEICCLTKKDISKSGVVHVSKSMAFTEDGEWVVKNPKSYSGDRYVPLPDFVYDEIKKIDGTNITHLSPEDITHKFWHITKNATGKIYRFHDLRHFCASTLASSGMSNAAIIQRCGWKNDKILIERYRHALKEKTDTENALANNIFTEKYSK